MDCKDQEQEDRKRFEEFLESESKDCNHHTSECWKNIYNFWSELKECFIVNIPLPCVIPTDNEIIVTWSSKDILFSVDFIISDPGKVFWYGRDRTKTVPYSKANELPVHWSYGGYFFDEDILRWVNKVIDYHKNK